MVQIHALLGLSIALASFTAAAPNGALNSPLLEARKPDPTPSLPLMAKRQQVTTGAFSAFTGTLPASISSVIATITSGTPSSFTEVGPKTTYSGGATNPSISDAPALPYQTLNPANFPTLDKSPDPSLPLSQEFIAKYDLSSVPNIPQTQGVCNGTALANAAANHWWTCGGHTVSSDITECPDKNTWGLSYDDGPSPYTRQLLDYMESENLKTTFFIVGSRALSRPDLLRYEYMTGHQLSVHTWSHPYLTTLTNQQILLELAWTMEVIRQATGVTPVTMRPPYGDIDDRVRAICRILGLTPIIWTSANGRTYDTNDWRIGAGQVSAASVVGNFTQILNQASSLSNGYIVLEHDLYQQSVELAVDVVLPMALAHQPAQTLEPIYQCLGLQLGDSYAETNRNVSGSGGLSSPGASNPTSNSSTSSSGSNSGGNVGTGAGTTSSSSSSATKNGASNVLPLTGTSALAFGAFLAFLAL